MEIQGIIVVKKDKWYIENDFISNYNEDLEYKVISAPHKDILDAWLADNSVEIEYHIERDLWAIDKNFIDKYEEDCEYRLKQQYSSLIESKDEPSIHLLRHLYHDLGTLKWIGADEGWDLAIEKVREYLSTELNNRLKPEQQYPIFKRSVNFIFKQTSEYDCEWVFHKNSYAIGNEFREYTGRDIVETIPYDKERGLYHLQPVWCWGNNWIGGRNIRFYSAETKKCIDVNNIKSAVNYDNIEPITPEQLKVMPWLFDMYQQVLKDNKIF